MGSVEAPEVATEIAGMPISGSAICVIWGLDHTMKRLCRLHVELVGEGRFSRNRAQQQGELGKEMVPFTRQFDALLERSHHAFHGRCRTMFT